MTRLFIYVHVLNVHIFCVIFGVKFCEILRRSFSYDLTWVPGIAFKGVLDKTVQVSFAAVSAEARSINQDSCPSPLTALVTAALNHPAAADSGSAALVENSLVVMDCLPQ